MKKVVIVRSNGVNPDSRVEKEANSLMNLGYKVTVLAWDRDENYKFRNSKLNFKDINCDIVRYGIKAGFGAGLTNLKPLLKSQIMILRYLITHTKEIDIIHACDFDTALISFLFAKIFNKKIVYDIFDYYVDAFSVPNKLKKFIEWIDIKVINNVNSVIIVNEARKAQIRKSNPKRLYVIHNSPKILEDELCRKERIIKKGEIIKLCYVGILGESRFLKEAVEVVAHNKKYQLDIGGFGNLEEYFIEASNEYENINYLGRMSYTDVIKLEKNSDILFAVYDPRVPNHKYSAPNKLYEALMLGKPIIVAKGTGIDKLVDKMEIGRSVEYSKQSFELALEGLVEDLKNEKDSLAKRCKKLYDENYSWAEMERRLKQLYSEI